MTQELVIFRDGQDLDPDDFMGLQEAARRSLDTLVADTVSSAQRFGGLTVTESGVASVGVATGRLYSAGRVYPLRTALVQDFLTALPVAGRKIVTVVAYGTESDTDVTPREFLVNEETRASEPRPVATRRARTCNIQFAYGVEAPNPTAPLVDAGYTAIADILLSPTGVDTITMRTGNMVGSLDAHEARLGQLGEFERSTGTKVQTLTSDLAGLAKRLGEGASTSMVSRMLLRLAQIEAKVGIPAEAVESHAFYFLDGRGSDLAHPLSHCKVLEGIRFPDAAAGSSTLALLNPLDPAARVVDGLMTPAYDRVAWLATGEQADEIRLSSYTYQTSTLVQKWMAREHVWYGTPFTVCTNNTWWQTGEYDAITGLFRRPTGDNNFIVVPTATDPIFGEDGQIHQTLRLQQYWTGHVWEDYWDTVTVDHNVGGTILAETWLQGQDLWLEAIGLRFTRLAATGEVRLAICEVSGLGLPDLGRVIALTTAVRADLQIAPAETVVPIIPTFLRAGQRYALAVITAADHWVATVPGEQFPHGTLFSVIDGAYAQGDGVRDLWMRLYRARPRGNRVSIQLAPLQLGGGILGIEINADAVVPAQCRLIYEIQVAGTWHALSDVSNFVLGQGGQIPPLLPFRVTLLGTADVMPAVRLDGSHVGVMRPDVSCRHVGAAELLPGSGSAQIRVIQRYEAWDDAHHTAAVKLRTGAGYATLTNATSTTDVEGVDPMAGAFLERTYVFNLGAAVTSFKAQTEMTTDVAALTCHVASHKDFAL